MVGYNESEGKSDSSSTSRPSTPAELGAYYKGIDKLTGGHNEWQKVPVYNKKGKPVFYSKGPYKGQQKTKRQQVYQPGRLGQLAKEGSPAVDYAMDASQVAYQPMQDTVNYQADQSDLAYSPLQRDVNYQADLSNLTYAPDQARVDYEKLTPDQLRALGGAGATRELQANRAYSQTADQIAADPRLSVFQAARGRQLAGRDLADSLDAISKENESALTGLAQKQNELTYAAGTDNRAYLADQLARAFESQQQNREYQAGERGRAFEADTSNRAFLADQLGKAFESQQQNREFKAGERGRAFEADTSNRAFLADQMARKLAVDQANREYLSGERGRAYDAAVRNADRTKDDLSTILAAFYGGKGQYTTSTNKQRSSSAGGNLL